MTQSRFINRHVLITGGGSGIGRAAALELAAEGADVTLLGRRADALEETAEGIRALGRVPTVMDGDTRDPDVVSAAVDAAWAVAPLDLLVTSAGTNSPGPFIDASVEGLRSMVDINVVGTMLACQAFGRRLIAAGRPGAIVCVSSQMGSVGFPGRAPYCATKHAVNGLVKALAVEWAASDIRVNAVAPTFVQTPLTTPMLADPDFRSEVLSRIPQGRLGTVEEVARAVAFLLSADASLTTGHILALDGGWTAI